MAIGYFLDKNHMPTPDELAFVLGSKLSLWNRLTKFLFDSYQMTGDLTFGGKKYGWNLWYRKSGKSLASLYPQQDGLIAQVVLGKDQVARAMQLDLGEVVWKTLRETPQFHDGRWLFIPVINERDADDIIQLLIIKKKPIKQT
jgi:hypothetical protein